MLDQDSELMSKFRISNVLVREALAEFLGTFLLTLGGNAVLATIFLGRFTIGPVVGPLGWGLSLVLALYVVAGVSGGHLNPAITIGMASIGKFPFKKVIVYCVFQYIGAFVAAALLYAVYYDAIDNLDMGTRLTPPHPNATAQIFSTFPQEYVSSSTGLVDQIVGTALLVIAICGVTDDRNMSISKGMIPIAIGLCFTCVQFTFSFNCMAAVNPARDLAPRFFTYIAGWGKDVFSYRDYNWFWVPVIGPHIGGIIGAWIYKGLVELHWPESSSYDMGFDSIEGQNQQFKQKNTADK